MTVKAYIPNEAKNKSKYWFKLNQLLFIFICIYIYVYIEKLWHSIPHPVLQGSLQVMQCPLVCPVLYVFTGSVDIISSTGLTQQVFGSLSIADKCIHFMETNKLYSLSPNGDITVIHLKLLVLENTYINQKMMSSHVFIYHASEVRGQSYPWVYG